MATNNAPFKADFGILAKANSTIEGQLTVSQDLVVTGNVVATGMSTGDQIPDVSGRNLGNNTQRWVLYAQNIHSNGTLTVVGDGSFNSAVTFANSVSVTGNVTVNPSSIINVGNVTLISSRITVGNSTVNSFINATAIETDGTLTVNGAASFANTLTVTGLSQVGNLNASGTANVTVNLNVGGNTTVSGFINVATTAQVSGNISLANTIIVATSNSTVNTLSFGITNVTFDSGVLFVDAINNRVGINNTAPGVAFRITGDLDVSATANVQGATNLRQNLTVAGNTVIQGTVHTVAGNVAFDTQVLFVDSVNNRVGINNNAPAVSFRITGDVDISATANVQGATNLRGAVTVSNDMVVTGNLTVTGTTTYVNTTTLNISDNIVTLNADEAGAPTQDAGIEVMRGTSANVTLRWNETSDIWENTSDGTNYFKILARNDIVDSVTNTSVLHAAAPNSVKTAYDAAIAANTLANTKVAKAGDTMSGSLLPSSNSLLLGNSTGRWVLSANTGDFSGNVFTGNSTVNVSMNVTNATSLGVTLANSTVTYTMRLPSLTEQGGTYFLNGNGSYIVPDHDALTNFVLLQHVNHNSVSIVAGDGLSGGGTIITNRTLNVVGNTGITANSSGVFNTGYGKIAIFIPADALQPRSANGCASLATNAGAANQPDVDYLAFDGASAEFAKFKIWMPKSWNRGTVTAKFAYRRASGTSAANTVWGIRGRAISSGDSIAAAFGSNATVTHAASTTAADLNLTGETGACTIAGTPVSEDFVFFEIFRNPASASDTLTVDAWLLGVMLFITTEAITDD